MYGTVEDKVANRKWNLWLKEDQEIVERSCYGGAGHKSLYGKAKTLPTHSLCFHWHSLFCLMVGLLCWVWVHRQAAHKGRALIFQTKRLSFLRTDHPGKTMRLTHRKVGLEGGAQRREGTHLWVQPLLTWFLRGRRGQKRFKVLLGSGLSEVLELGKKELQSWEE